MATGVNSFPAPPPKIIGSLSGLLVPVSKLTIDPENARVHSERNLKAIARSLERFGQMKPIVHRKGQIIAGNGTFEAATKLLGWKKIAAVDASDLTPAQAKAYGIMDNRSAELAEWDVPKLGELLEDIDSEFEDATGFEEGEFDDLLVSWEHAHATEIVEDEVPEPPKVAVTKPGDLWTLGRHRLLCGDATKAEDVRLVLDEARPFLSALARR